MNEEVEEEGEVGVVTGGKQTHLLFLIDHGVICGSTLHHRYLHYKV